MSTTLQKFNPHQVKKYVEWKQKNLEELKMLHEDYDINTKFNIWCKNFFTETRWFKKLQGVR